MNQDLQEQAPFSFDCHRCGHCCRVGHGQVWVTEQDVAAMATQLELPIDAFVLRFVRRVDGRLSIREESDGSCALLDGGNHCVVYEQRPDQCRTFPYWPQLMVEGNALEQAAGYCLGIQRYPSIHLVKEVLPQVYALMLEAGAAEISSVDVEPLHGAREASSLEVDLFLATGRRLLHPDPEMREVLRRQLQDLAQRSGYPWSHAPWARLLADRRGGWSNRIPLPALALP